MQAFSPNLLNYQANNIQKSYVWHEGLMFFFPFPKGFPVGHKVGTRPTGAQAHLKRQEVHDTLQLPTFQRPGTGNWELRGFFKIPLSHFLYKIKGLRSQKDAFFANS